MPITIHLKVIPQSGTFKLMIDKNGTLKCYLKSAAQDGKANKELMKEFSKILKIPQSDITILLGEFQPKKIIKIALDCTIQELYKKLSLEWQKTIL